jgi:hypothetical protein
MVLFSTSTHMSHKYCGQATTTSFTIHLPLDTTYSGVLNASPNKQLTKVQIKNHRNPFLELKSPLCVQLILTGHLKSHVGWRWFTCCFEHRTFSAWAIFFFSLLVNARSHLNTDHTQCKLLASNHGCHFNNPFKSLVVTLRTKTPS